MSDLQLRRDLEVSVPHVSAGGLSMGARCEQDSLHQTLALEKGHICLVRFEVPGCCGKDRDKQPQWQRMGGESCHWQAGDMVVALGDMSGGVKSSTLSVSRDLPSRFLETVWLTQ